MITGAQIRASLKLLDWTPLELSERTRIAAATLIGAEAAAGAAALTMVQENAIRRALTTAGIEFAAEGDGQANVLLRKPGTEAHSQSRRKADVIVRYLQALRAKLRHLHSGDTETLEGADAIALLFPPGVRGEDVDPRSEAVISTFAESCRCDYDYEPSQNKLRFIKR